MDVCVTPHDNSLQVYETLSDIFEHIKSVQEDISKLSLESMQKINDLLFSLDIEFDEDIYIALQHQDILNQQLKAISELSQTIQKHIENHQDDQTLESKFLCALEIAKAKKEAYRGKAF